MLVFIIVSEITTCVSPSSHLVHHPYMKIKKENIAMSKVNRPITPEKPVPTTTSKKVETMRREEHFYDDISFNNGQSLVLGMSLGAGNNKTLDRTKAVASGNEESIFQAAYSNENMTYRFNDGDNKANKIKLGSASHLYDSDVTIVLGKNDTIEGSPLAKVSSVENEDDDNYRITLTNELTAGNKAGTVTNTVTIIVPKDSLEEATANFTDKQKKALGVLSETTLAERLRPETVKEDDRYNVEKASKRKPRTQDEAGTYFNPEDKNKDGKLVLSSKANRAETYNLADNELEGSPKGKDVAQSLEIGELDPDFAGKKKLNINLGENDTIADIPKSTVEQVSTDEDGVTTLRLLQKNENGGRRSIKITLPKDNLEKAIENLDPKLKDAILAKGETSQEDPPRRITQEEIPRGEERRNQPEEITFGKPTKIPSLDKKTPTYRLGSSSLQLPEFSASDAKASPFFKP